MNRAEFSCMSKTANKYAPEVRVRMVLNHECDYT